MVMCFGLYILFGGIIREVVSILLTGGLTAYFWSEDDQCFKHYFIRTTKAERRKILRSFWRSLWVGTWADSMGPELEELMCGWKKDRYVELQNLD